MAHHCQELCLRTVSLCGTCVGKSHLLFRAAPLRDARSQDEKCRGRNAHESLKSNQTLVQRGPDKWTMSHGCAPNRYHRDCEGGGYRSSLAEPERRPDEQRKKHIRLRDPSRGRRDPHGASKNQQACGDYGDAEGKRLHPALRVKLPWTSRPNEQNRSNQEVRDEIAQPPRAPGFSQLTVRDDPSQIETCYAYRGADHRAQAGSKNDQSDHVGKALERDLKTGNSTQGVHSENWLQRIPDSDSQRNWNGGAGEDIGEKGADEHPRPQSGSEKQQRGKRQSTGCQTSVAKPPTASIIKPARAATRYTIARAAIANV